ncbi:MAG: tetratricopeptide repeat protein [Clostridia bacterium]|nr:tetratricopeptide repeat protein [Clostridia bacterium]
MSEINQKNNHWGKALRIVAFTVAMVMVLHIVAPSTLQVLYAFAEENTTLARIYGILSDNAVEPTTAEDYYERANISIGQQKFDQALEELDKARSLTEDKVLQAELWLRTASVHALLGNLEQGKAALDECLATKPDATQALLLRAQIAIEMGTPKAAAADYISYLELVPGDTASRLTLAQLLESIASYKEASAQYAKLYELNPADEAHQLNAMRCLFLAGEYEEALKGFDQYIALHENDEQDGFGGIAVFLRAASLMQLGRYDEAAEGFEKAIEAGYDKMACLEQITLCCFETANYDRVVSAGEELLANATLTAPETVLQRMALSRMRQSNYEDALVWFDRIKEIQPAMEGNEYYRGVCLLTLNRQAEAVEAFTASIESGYLLQFCYYNRGVCYVDLLEYEKAIEDMALTLESGDDPDLIAAAKDILWQLAAYFEQNGTAPVIPD